jgi:hypothetical protein
MGLTNIVNGFVALPWSTFLLIEVALFLVVLVFIAAVASIILLYHLYASLKQQRSNDDAKFSAQIEAAYRLDDAPQIAAESPKEPSDRFYIVSYIAVNNKRDMPESEMIGGPRLDYGNHIFRCVDNYIEIKAVVEFIMLKHSCDGAIINSITELKQSQLAGTSDMAIFVKQIKT